MPIALALLLTGQLPSVGVQEPSIEERVELADRFYRAPGRIRGGTVRARWLDDGTSLVYRDGRTERIVEPGERAPREATEAELARVVAPLPAQREGRVYAPDSDHYASLVDGLLVVAGGGIEGELHLTGAAEEDVTWSLDPGAWSADGSLLFSTWLDVSALHHLPIVDFARALETVEWVPYAKTGAAFGRQGLSIFKLPEGSGLDVDTGPDEDGYLFALGWREGDRELLFLRLNREATRLELRAADPDTGASRVILTETMETFVGGLDFITGGWRDVFTAVEGTDELLWLSERDGWRHVYRYGFDGELIGRVTAGAFPVLSVAGVDAARGRVFLMANAEDRLYDTHLYRADLDGGELVRLTEGEGEHSVQLSPSRERFVDTHSSLERPPRSELRDTDGALVCVLAEADVSALERLGWTPPEPFVTKAADGETDLHGVLFKPSWFDPAARYPVIDEIYSGPFMTIVPNEYGCRAPHARRAQALAQTGFVVMLLDPRGTTERSKAFQDASHGRIGQIEIPDHVAALRQVAAERPYLDLDRVGVHGHSWGGYFALRAMLTAPEVFHAGVAGAPGELTEAAPINEPYMRLPANNPEGYAAAYNAPLAANLEGELMIVHGTADVNAPFSTSVRMVAALIDADKDFDFLVLPGATHSFQGRRARYVTRRIRAFFLEHLRGEAAAR